LEHFCQIILERCCKIILEHCCNNILVVAKSFWSIVAKSFLSKIILEHCCQVIFKPFAFLEAHTWIEQLDIVRIVKKFETNSTETHKKLQATTQRPGGIWLENSHVLKSRLLLKK
jgi:hypothetical protein